MESQKDSPILQNLNELQIADFKEEEKKLQTLPKLVWAGMNTFDVSAYDIANDYLMKSISSVSKNGIWPLVERIPDSECFISAGFNTSYTSITITDLSDNKPKALHYEKLQGSIAGISCNAKKRIAVLVSLRSKNISYHLFDLEKYSVVKKARWPPECLRIMNGLDFHPQGEMIAMIDQGGQLVVSEVDTDKLLFKKEMMTNELATWYNRCRWNPNESVVAVKYKERLLQLVDVEKDAVIFDDQGFELCSGGIEWIDWRYDGNLLSFSGDTNGVKVLDKREKKIVRTFNNLNHTRATYGNCWSACGRYLACCCDDGKVNVIDFTTEKAIVNLKGTGQVKSVCFV